MLSLSFFSLNARGLRNNVKRKALFLYAKQFKKIFVTFKNHILFQMTSIFGNLNGVIPYGFLMVQNVLREWLH